GQDYFPEGMGRRTFYEPRGEGSEARVRERLERWSGMRAKRSGGGRS
ncbi:MAG: replication-associated recombination protein A, partial [Phenylobacterium sp.]|nr:replication-associated recombination protein A [Phenylobacterium sp.]